ncbi:MAG: glutamate--tRNA ligase [Patescibacteria group bacterium]|nr:glutamate--tRNA ligase [Patescibacteria group bacterium]
MTEKQKIKVRIAPSPTGTLHIGTARTALFNYLFAKKNQGEFILRIEDTDIERSDKKYEEDIIKGLKWLGLEWDKEPKRQSERTEIYQKYIKKLLDSGQAFWCNHTKEELEEEKKGQIERKEAPRHICSDYQQPKSTRPVPSSPLFTGLPRRFAPRNDALLSLRAERSNPREEDEIAASRAPRNEDNKKGIIRFRCPDKKIVFNDLIKGKMEFDCGLLGDIGIARDERTPLYNLAVVIDDIEMKISHVIRGEDHISNTPKQILLFEALGIVPPQYAHIPLILRPDKAKLSKRYGAVSISDYKEMGYLPEALINFMAFLGWHPGDEREIFSLEELTQEFSIEKVNKSNAVFDIEKLDWFNGQYIRKMDLDELTKKCLPYLKLSLREVKGDEVISFDYAKKVVALEQERLKKLSEIGELTKFFFIDKLDYPAELLIWKKMSLEKVKDNLEILEKTLAKTGDFDKKTLEDAITPLTEKHGVGDMLWPLRAALTGEKASPGPYEVMEVLGKERTLKRIKEAIVVLEK